MPHYFFKVINDDVTDDPEGYELIDDTAARAYAIQAARALAAETVSKGHIGLSHRIEIENEARDIVGAVTFAEAVEVRE